MRGTRYGTYCVLITGKDRTGPITSFGSETIMNMLRSAGRSLSSTIVKHLVMVDAEKRVYEIVKGDATIFEKIFRESPKGSWSLGEIEKKWFHKMLFCYWKKF